MTLYYAANVAAGVLDGTQPPRLAPASQNAGRVHSHLVVIDLATIKSSALGTSDAVHLGRLPKGGRFLYGISAATATLGASAQIAIGTSATHGSNGQFRASAVHTAVETPALFGLTTAVDDPPLTDDTDIYMTVGTAALVATGVLTILLVYATV